MNYITDSFPSSVPITDSSRHTPRKNFNLHNINAWQSIVCNQGARCEWPCQIVYGVVTSLSWNINHSAVLNVHLRRPLISKLTYLAVAITECEFIPYKNGSSSAQRKSCRKWGAVIRQCFPCVIVVSTLCLSSVYFCTAFVFAFFFFFCVLLLFFFCGALC